MNYEHRLKRWIARYGIKQETKLFLLKKHIPSDWENSWENEMNDHLGEFVTVGYITLSSNGGISINEDNCEFTYPYTAFMVNGDIFTMINKNINIL